MKKDDLYNMARQVIIYGDFPIDAITGLSDTALEGLRNYAMKETDPQTVKQLNDDDAWLLSMLVFIEINRRDAAGEDEFLTYLRGRAEWLETLAANERTRISGGWVQAYEMLIKLRQLSAGRKNSSVIWQHGSTVTR